MLLVLASAGVAIVAAATPGGGTQAGQGPPLALGTDDDSDPADKGTLHLKGEWLVLKFENAWLDASDPEQAAERERNDRRIAQILRRLDAPRL
jgi:hypothetical protein